MLEYVSAECDDMERWTAEQIREDSPEDANRIPDDHIGLLVHSGEGDGALIIGTPAELRAYLAKLLLLIP